MCSSAANSSKSLMAIQIEADVKGSSAHSLEVLPEMHRTHADCLVMPCYRNKLARDTSLCCTPLVTLMLGPHQIASSRILVHRIITGFTVPYLGRDHEICGYWVDLMEACNCRCTSTY